MSDAVIISVVGSLTTTLGIIVVAWLNTRQNKIISGKVDDVKKNTDGLVTAALAAKDETSEAKQDLSKEIGRSEGIAEKQKEVDTLHKDASINIKIPLPASDKPIDVNIVDQTKPVEVTNKPKK